MSTGAGEDDPNKNEWPTQTDLIIFPVRRQFVPHSELEGAEVTARLHAHLADAYGKDYTENGDAESLGQALHHYETAFDMADNEPLLQAWIVCRRLNIYLHDLQAGRAEASDVEDELNLAHEIASGAWTLRDRQFRSGTLAWIARTREMIFAAPADETTQEDIRQLRLVGGTALGDVKVLDSAPEPGAA